MGADITLYDKKLKNEVMYFRDAYNNGNLLWLVEGSYWEMHRKATEAAEDPKTHEIDPLIFDFTCAEYLRVHYNLLNRSFNSLMKGRSKEDIKWFKDKLDNLKKLIELVETQRYDVVWSV